MDPLSDAIRSRRLELGLTLDDIYRRTRINPDFLEALETGQYDVLPEAYSLLFLKRYAEELQLDPDEVQRAFQDIQSPGEVKTPNPTPAYTRSSAYGPAFTIVGVLGILVLLTIWAFEGSGKRQTFDGSRAEPAADPQDTPHPMESQEVATRNLAALEVRAGDPETEPPASGSAAYGTHDRRRGTESSSATGQLRAAESPDALEDAAAQRDDPALPVRIRGLGSGARAQGREDGESPSDVASRPARPPVASSTGPAAAEGRMSVAAEVEIPLPTEAVSETGETAEDAFGRAGVPDFDDANSGKASTGSDDPALLSEDAGRVPERTVVRPDGLSEQDSALWDGELAADEDPDRAEASSPEVPQTVGAPATPSPSPPSARERVAASYSLSPPRSSLRDSLLQLTGLARQTGHVMVVADGDTVFSEPMAPGDIQDWQARSRLMVELAQPSAISLSLQGWELGTVAREGRRLRLFITRASIWVEEVEPVSPNAVADL